MDVIITMPMMNSVKNCLPERDFSEEEVVALIRAAFEPLGMMPLMLDLNRAVLEAGLTELQHHFPNNDIDIEIAGLVFASMVEQVRKQNLSK